MIDYKNYLTMNNNDLKKLIEHAQNILDVRQQDEIDAMMNMDKAALLKTFEQNDSRELSHKAWQAFNIYNVTFDTLDFFELLRTLPQYELKNKQKYPESYEQRLTDKAFENIDYLNYFLSKEDYRSIIIKQIGTRNPFKYVNPHNYLIVDTLIEKGLLQKPNNEILNQIKQWPNPERYTGYLEYALTNHNVVLPKEQAQEFFKQYWANCNTRLVNTLWNEYCSDIKMDLDQGVKSYSTTMYPDKAEMYANFVSTSKEHFKLGLKIFDVTIDSVSQLMNAMRKSITNDYNLNNRIDQSVVDNMVELFSYVKQNLPEARTIMESYVQDDRFAQFKKIANPMILYLQLDQDIPLSNENSQLENSVRSPKI